MDVSLRNTAPGWVERRVLRAERLPDMHLLIFVQVHSCELLDDLACPVGTRAVRPACARLEDERVELSLDCPGERVLLNTIIFGELNKQWIRSIVAGTGSVCQ